MWISVRQPAFTCVAAIVCLNIVLRGFCFSNENNCIYLLTSPYHDGNSDVACDSPTTIFTPWSGFRIIRQIGVYNNDEKHSMRISYCRMGSEIQSIDSPIHDYGSVADDGFLCNGVQYFV